jgi:hypothetical protein
MTYDELISVSAALVRCNLMFDLWDKHKDELLKLYPGLANGDARTDDKIIVQESSSYLILAVTLLFVVIEFCRDHFVCFPDSIRADIEIMYPKLKEFRNCVCHTQGKLLSNRQLALLEHPNSLEVLRRIHDGVDAQVQSVLARLPADDPRHHNRMPDGPVNREILTPQRHRSNN